jgi:hypothetical protein
MKEQKYLLLVILALLVRLLLMPWFGHEDIFLTYNRAYEIAQSARKITSVDSMLPHAVETAWVGTTQLIIGHDYWSDLGNDLVDISKINSKLFLMKLPYLLAEMLFWVLLIKWWKPDKKLVYFVLFNPVVIYSVYMFGRYESFVMLFLLMLIEAIKRSSLGGAIGSLILLLATRFSVFMIIPAFFGIQIPKKINKKTMGLGMGLLLVALAVLLPVIGKLPSIIQGQHFSFLLAANFDLTFGVYLYILPMLVTILVTYVIKVRWVEKFTIQDNSVWFSAVSLALLYLYYALAIFHPQYFVWSLVPLFYLLHTFNKDRFLWLSAVLQQILFFGILFIWGGYTTLGLLTPVSDIFWQIGLGGMDEGLKMMSNLVKSGLSGLLLYSSYYVMTDLLMRNKRG